MPERQKAETRYLSSLILEDTKSGYTFLVSGIVYLFLLYSEGYVYFHADYCDALEHFL